MYFYSQQPSFKEKLIGPTPRFILRHCVKKGRQARAVYSGLMRTVIYWFKNSESIRATCYEYRNNARVDFENKKADNECGHSISCPS